jgi:hypothetical protein
MWAAVAVTGLAALTMMPRRRRPAITEAIPVRSI